MNKLDDEDRDLFRSSIGGVKPLTQNRVLTRQNGPAPFPMQRMADEEQALLEMADGSNDPVTLETGEELYFRRGGIQNRLFEKLKRGQMKIEYELDLHGMTIAAAKAGLAAFFVRARTANWRCIRIIHGKGRNSPNGVPVLKGKVNQWLQQRDEVLAFCSAQRRDGGTGAVYVLLKRN